MLPHSSLAIVRFSQGRFAGGTYYSACFYAATYSSPPRFMMNEGKIILDISGEEKKSLTKADLLQKFAQVAGVQEETDAVLLS